MTSRLHDRTFTTLIGLLSLLSMGWMAPASSAVVISEFMAANNGTLDDEDGDASDWIELHNNGGSAATISGWYLTDDDTALTKWQLPALTLAAGQYLVVFASDKDRTGSELHTNFKLSAGGEYLGLVQSNGTTIADEYAPEYPEQFVDIGYGVDSGNTRAYLPTPTPGAANSAGVSGVAEQPEFSVAHGFYDTTQSLILTSPTPGAQIRYTLDGSTPPGGSGCSAPANGDRVNYQYFQGNWSALPDFDALTPIATGTSNLIDISERQRDSQYALRFTGCIYAQYAGTYQFFTTSDDGSQLFIGNQLVVDNDGVHGAQERNGTIALSPGLHPVTVTMFQRTGGQSLSVAWTPLVDTNVPGVKQTLLPAKWLTYSTPISISATTTVRAVAVRDTFLDSRSVTQSYLFASDIALQHRTGGAPAGWPAGSVNSQLLNYGMDPDIVDVSPAAVQDSLLSIPTISIVTDQVNLTDPTIGVYVNANESGREWERPTSIELIDPSGSEGGFTINAGLRMRGGFSRSANNPKHSFRLFFRGDYGGDLEYPLYGDDGASSYEKIDFRTSQNYSWAFLGSEYNTFLREVFSRDTFGAMGNNTTRSRYFHMYLNGVYWGLYMSQERISKEYAVSYLEGEEDNFDVVKHDRQNDYRFDATDGQGDAWRQLHSLVVDQTISASEYTTLNAQVDLDNLIDLNLLNAYTGDLDGSPSWFLRSNSIRNARGNNWYAARDRTGAGSPWVFFDHDSEHTLLVRREPDEINRVGPFTPFNGQSNIYFNNSDYMNPYWLHGALLSNVDYRQRVIDRVESLFKNDGLLTPNQSLQRWLERRAQVAGAVLAESARWGDAKRSTPFTVNDWQTEVSFVQNTVFPTRTSVVLAQLANQGLAPTVDVPLSTLSANSLTLNNPNGAGTLYYTTDGSDPRALGGGLSGSATTAANGATLTFQTTTTVWIRIRNGSNWSAPVQVTVQGNAAPTVTSPGSVYLTIASEGEIAVDATDVNGDNLTFNASGLPAGLSIGGQSGIITGIATSTGTYTPQVSVSDGQLSTTVGFNLTVTPRARLVLNEYNAVSGSKWLGGGDGTQTTPTDSTLGRIVGNGGDWFELLVLEQGLDLRGWSLSIVDDGALDALLQFSNDGALANLPAGTIITIAEEAITTESGSVIGQDASVNPSINDWSMHLIAGNGGTGQYVTASNFKVSNSDWQLTILDNNNQSVFGPVGEGIAIFSGVGSEEVGKLEASPTPVTNVTGPYNDGTSSTFAAANVFAGGAQTQDFSALRGNGNSAPVLQVVNNQAASEGVAYSLTLNASDADNDALVYSATGLPQGVSVDYQSGSISGTPATASAGVYPVTVVVDDGTVSVSRDFFITVTDPGGTNSLLSVADLVVNENDGTANVVISVSPSSASAIQVGLHSRKASAIGGQDFIGFTLGAINIAAGVTQVTVPVTLVNDTVTESTEFFQVRLYSPAGAIIADAIADITVLDDDAVASSTLSVGDITVSEGVGVANIAVTLSAARTNTVTVGVHSRNLGSAQGGQDYYGFTASLTFAPGETTQTVAFTVLDDIVVESIETFGVRLYDAIGAQISQQEAIVTISDDDAVGTPSFSLADITVNEGAGSAQATVILTNPSNQTASVSVHTRANTATGGQDYFGFTQTLSFPVGVTQQTVTVTLIDDTAAEGTESLLLRMYDANGAVIVNETATVTIIDND